MAKQIDFDLQRYDGEFKAAGMARLVKAANVICEMIKANCVRGTITRVPGRRRFVFEGHLVPSTHPPIWMERTPGAMRETVRVVRSNDPGSQDNVRIYAGNFKTWWALQMEYGSGKWKGGAKPFMRPALHAAPARIQPIIEGD